LVKELNNLIELVADPNTENKQITDNQKIMGFDVHTNISIKVGLLESLSTPNENKLTNKEPLVDVFESDDNIKLVALIPGIKKEDISTIVSNGFIEVRIRKGESEISRNIPCNVKPNQIVITSFTYNNSVLEIVFKKGDM
jgi:HSP20 family protein